MNGDPKKAKIQRTFWRLGNDICLKETLVINLERLKIPLSIFLQIEYFTDKWCTPDLAKQITSKLRKHL